MNKLILAAAVLSASVSTQGVIAANDDNNGKVSVCHNGRTVSINSSGLQGHLGHGDSQGSCEDRRSAVVIMQCAPDGDGIVVDAVSSSPFVDPEVVPTPGPDSDCATALAAMVDAQLAIRSVTASGNGATEYLLLGYVGISAAP